MFRQTCAIRKYIALLFLLLILSSCGMGGASVSGTVIDKSTGKPIEGAIVVARWKGSVFNPAHVRTTCFHVESTTTDKDGAFHIPFWMGLPKGIVDQERHLRVYKPGYTEEKYRNTRDRIKKLEPFTGTREERFEYLRYAGVSCTGSGKNMRKLYEMNKAIYEEMKGLARTQEEKKLVGHYRRGVARDAVAEDRHMTTKELDQLIDEYLEGHLK